MPVMQHRLPPARGRDADLTELADYEAAGGYAALRRRACRRWTATRSLYQFLRSGPARTGRRGLPDGSQGQLPPEELAARPPTSSATPTRASRAPSRTGRSWTSNPFQLLEGIAIAGVRRSGRTARLHLHPGRVRAPGAGARPGDRPGPGRGVPRRPGRAAPTFAFDITVYRGAGAYICGEETALAREPRGQARPAAAQAAVPGRRRPVRLADAHQQRRDPRRAARRSSSTGADWYAAIGTEKSTGTKIFSVSGPRAAPGQLRDRARRHHAARADRTTSPAASGPAGEFKAAGSAGPACHVLGAEAPRHAARLRVARRRRARSSAPAGAS